MFLSYLLTFLLLTLTFTNGNVINKQQPRDHRLHPEFKETGIPSPKQLTESNSEYWLNNAKNHLNEKLTRKLNENVAKNIILFVGDGMSTPTLSAARVLLGGEEEFLSFEKFPYIGLSKTYCLDQQVADSACTSTSYLTGVKANVGTAGVNGKVNRGSCSVVDELNYTKSLAKWAVDAGKLVGFVTTTRVTHASPSGNYAHIAERGWEDDSSVLKDCQDSDNKPVDIALQLIESEIDFKVILGGGRARFRGKSVQDEEGNFGLRTDERNLIDEWKEKRDSNGDTFSYVWNRDSLKLVDQSTNDYLFGLFAPSHLFYHLEALDTGRDAIEPTLEEMTEKAIEILSKGENGFFLFVEGGLIDSGHHDNLARVALDETLEFSKAIDMARKKLSEDDSLIVVTSDHSHTMSYSGYAVSYILALLYGFN